MNRSPLLATLLLSTAMGLALPGGAGCAQGTTKTSASPPVYVPPDVGSPQARQGAATRSNRDGVLALDVLAPDHVGLTTRAQPNLYWYVSGPGKVKVKITVLDETSPDPVLDTGLDQIASEGIYRISLRDHHVKLVPGLEYEWYVALVSDPGNPARDVVSGGVIKRVPEDAARKPGAGDDGLGRVNFYAANGYWYDAVDELSVLLDTSTHSEILHAYRAGLLEQVALPDAAEFARSLTSTRE